MLYPKLPAETASQSFGLTWCDIPRMLELLARLAANLLQEMDPTSPRGPGVVSLIAVGKKSYSVPRTASQLVRFDAGERSIP